MKSKIYVLMIIGAILVSFVIGLSADAQMQRQSKAVWEYKDGANLTVDQLNTYGSDGWEVVSVVAYGRDLYYILKRPK
jgi:hypothetical protein